MREHIGKMRSKISRDRLRKHVTKKNFHKLLVAALAAFFILGSLIILWGATLDIPDFSNFQERKIAQSTKIYDRTGKILLNSVQSDKKRSVIPIAEISLNIKNATIAIEDAEFYNHHGIRPKAIVRAFLANILPGGLMQGGSTITQQVVKNAILTQEKTITRKIKEAIIALKIERVMTKDEILGLYLNESPYGGNLYGVEEASQKFFGKSARDVSLAEAAYIAALPQAPTFYSPYGTHQKELTARKNLVLDRMQVLGFITSAEADAAKKEVVSFLPLEKQGIKAPHFVFYVRDYLEEHYGKDAVETGGLKVTTTLDWDLQEKAEELVAQYAAENETKYNAHNAGVVGLDPKTGEVLVMVGSRDYFETTNNGNFNVTLAHRQPGSAFKPIVYATAFMKGYTPDTVLFDLPTEFAAACTPEVLAANPKFDDSVCYKPVNYDGLYRGPMSLRDALAQSINIPAIKVLYLSGIKNALKTARDVGITTLGTDPNRYGLTLVLGGGEVSLLELTGAYGVFANDGVRVPRVSILKVEDSSGHVLEEHAAESGVQAITSDSARLISDVLSDNKARTPGYGARSPLYFEGRDVAVKTGTTNDYRDTWIVGYTPNFALGAWVGNNDNTPMEKKVAGFVVAPMWHAIMAEVLKKVPAETFEEPAEISKDLKPVLRGLWQGGESYFIDRVSGKRATEYTPDETKEERVLTNVHSILYWVDKDDPLGPRPTNPSSDPQFNLWDKPIREWAQSHGYVDQDASNIPTAVDDVHRADTVPQVNVSSPADNATVDGSTPLSVLLEAHGLYPISEVRVYFNGTLVGTSLSAPWTITFTPNDITGVNSTNELSIVVYDSVREKTTVTKSIFIR